MDLELYGRVLWRFRLVVGFGLLLAIVLTIFATAKVDFGAGKLTYRAKEQWAAYSQIFVRERKFAYGDVRPGRRDPSTFAPNAIIIANLANTDAVRQLAFGNKPVPGTVEAAALTTSPTSTDALPIISIAGLADSAAKAKYLTRNATRGLIRYVRIQDERSAIAPRDRVMLEVIKQPNAAKLLKGRSQTLPIVIFLTVMAAVIGLVFILENLRPRVRVVDSQDQDRHVQKATSRSA
jgi:hypothetical protein